METLKSNPSITYRVATQSDIEIFYGQKAPYTMKAIIFFLDGVPFGIGGYKIDSSRFIIFSEMKENVKVSKYTILRCAKIIMDLVKERGSVMIAASQNKKLCEMFGLKHVDGEIFEWKC